MNLVNPFRFAGEYKIEFDGIDGVMQWSATANLHKIEMKIDTPEVTNSSGSGMWMATQGTNNPRMGIGGQTGNASNETLGIYNISEGTYIRDTISAGVHIVIFEWNGSHYDISIDGNSKTVYSSDNGHIGLVVLDEFGGRSNSGDYTEIDLHYLKLEDSGGLVREWPCNDGFGTNVSDELGNGDATLSGGYTWIKL